VSQRDRNNGIQSIADENETAEGKMTRLASVDRPIEVRSERRPGWFWIDNEVIDNFGSVIGVAGVAVYCALARNAREGCCAPRTINAKHSVASEHKEPIENPHN
jgi:hypothetical protein